MTKKSRNTLKGYFETGKRPTEGQYADLIDSHLILNGENTGSLDLLGDISLDGNLTTSGNLITTGSATFGTGTVVINGTAGHITASGNISASGNYTGVSASLDYINASGNIHSNKTYVSSYVKFHDHDHPSYAHNGSSDPAITALLSRDGNINTWWAGIAIGNYTDGTAPKSGAGMLSVKEDAIIEGHLTSSGNISSSGTVIANAFIGDGSGLTNITSTNTIQNVTLVTASIATGSLYLTGSVMYTSGSTNVLLGIESSGSILPGKGGEVDLGSPTKYWKSSFVSESHADKFIGTLEGNASTATLVTQAAQSNITSLGTLTSLAASGNISTPKTGSFGEINLDDGKKLKLGTSGDLVIQHNGAHSHIHDTGTGDLLIDATNLRLRNTGGANYLYATSGGAVGLYYNGTQKFATTNTGVNITGQITASGNISASGVGSFSNIGVDEYIYHNNNTGTNDTWLRFQDNQIEITTDTLVNFRVNPLAVTVGNGSDVDFIVRTDNDLHTIHAVGSNDNVGIGTASPTARLDVVGNINTSTHITASGNISGSGDNNIFGKTTIKQHTVSTGSAAGITIHNTSTGDSIVQFLNPNNRWIAGIDNSDADKFKISGGAGANGDTGLHTSNKLTILIDGKTGIGTTTPTEKFQVEGSISASGDVLSNGTGSFGYVTATEISSSGAVIGLSGSFAHLTNVSTTAITASGGISASGTIYANTLVVNNFTPTHITASGNISASGTGSFGEINLDDNKKIKLGTGGDLEIYHTGTESHIKEIGTGDLFIQATNLKLRDVSGKHYMVGNSGGSVTLWYNDAQKLATTNTGVSITGDLTSTGTGSFEYGHFTHDVGIGVAPTGLAALQVRDITPSKHTTLLIDSTGAADMDVTLSLSSSAQEWVMKQYAQGAVGTGQYELQIGDATNSSVPVRIGTGQNTDTLVLSGSRVGIATNTPGEKLEVIGNISASGKISGKELNINSPSNFNGSTHMNRITIDGGHSGSEKVRHYHAALDLYNPLEANTLEKGSILTFSDNFSGSGIPQPFYGRTTRAAIKGGTDTIGNTANGFLAFYTDEGTANTMPERMRINYEGKVSIGTSGSSAALLTVAGAISASGNITGLIGSFSKIGIGIISPRAKLDIGPTGNLGAVTNKEITSIIDGGYSTTNSLQYNVNAFIGTTFGTTDIFASTASETKKNFYVGIISNNSYFNNPRWSVVNNGAERLVVDQSTGNVGIGTTTPSKALTVTGDISSSGNITTTVTGSFGNIEVQRAIPTIRLTDTRNLNNPNWDNKSLGSYQWYTSDTTSPGAKVGAEIEAYSGTGAASAPEFNLHFKTATNLDAIASTKLVITAGGMVGIGVTSPHEALHVSGNIKQTNGAQSLILSQHPSSNYVKIDVGGTGHTADRIHLGDDTTTTNNITTFGKIGIGTINPTSKLSVYGDIWASGSQGHITASGNISASGVLTSNTVEIKGGSLDIKNTGAQSYARFYCESANAHYSEIKAQPHALFSGNVTTLLPAYNFNFASPHFIANITASGNISSSGVITANSYVGLPVGIFSGSVATISGSLSSTAIASLGAGIFSGSVATISGSLSSTAIAALGAGIYSSSLQTLGNITASGNISSSGVITANSYVGLPSNLFSGSFATISGSLSSTAIAALGAGIYSSSLQILGNITSSGGISIVETGSFGYITSTNISASGTIIANNYIGLPSGIFSGSVATISGSLSSTAIASLGAGIFSGSVATISGSLSSTAIVALGAGIISSSAGGVNVVGHITASGNISASGTGYFGEINLDDSKRIKVGTGDDLQIWHDGSNSYISDQGTGNLRILAQNFTVRNPGNDENMITATPDGAVVLYYDNSIKSQTTATGVNITGDVTASGNISSSGHIVGNSISVGGDVYGNVSLFGSGSGTYLAGTNTSAQWRVNGGQKIHIYSPTVSTGKITLQNIDEFHISANITSSGNISASGTLYGNQTIIAGHITSSGNISSSGTLYAEHFYSSDDATIIDTLTAGHLTTTGNLTVGNASTDKHIFTGHITSSHNISSSGTVQALILEGRSKVTTANNTSAVNTTMTEVNYPGGSIIGLDMDSNTNDIQYTLPSLTAGLRYTFLVNTDAGTGVTLTLTSPSSGDLAGMSVCRDGNEYIKGTNFVMAANKASKGDRLEVISDGNIYNLTVFCSASISDVSSS